MVWPYKKPERKYPFFWNGSKIFAVILLEEKLEMDLGFKGKPDLKTL
jgi:hypothetical protein